MAHAESKATVAASDETKETMQTAVFPSRGPHVHPVKFATVVGPHPHVMMYVLKRSDLEAKARFYSQTVAGEENSRLGLAMFMALHRGIAKALSGRSNASQLYVEAVYRPSRRREADRKDQKNPAAAAGSAGRPPEAKETPSQKKERVALHNLFAEYKTEADRSGDIVAYRFISMWSEEVDLEGIFQRWQNEQQSDQLLPVDEVRHAGSGDDDDDPARRHREATSLIYGTTLQPRIEIPDANDPTRVNISYPQRVALQRTGVLGTSCVELLELAERNGDEINAKKMSSGFLSDMKRGGPRTRNMAQNSLNGFAATLAAHMPDPRPLHPRALRARAEMELKQHAQDLKQNPLRLIQSIQHIKDIMCSYNITTSLAQSILGSASGADAQIFVDVDSPFRPISVFNFIGGMARNTPDVDKTQLYDETKNFYKFVKARRDTKNNKDHVYAFKFPDPSAVWSLSIEDIGAILDGTMFMHGMEIPQEIGPMFKKQMDHFRKNSSAARVQAYRVSLGIALQDGDVMHEERQRFMLASWKQDANLVLPSSSAPVTETWPMGDPYEAEHKNKTWAASKRAEIETVMRLAFIAGRANQCTVAVGSVVTFETVKAINKKLWADTETEINMEKYKVSKGLLSKKAFEEYREKRMDEYRQKALQNFNPIWQREGSISPASNEILKWLHEFLESPENRSRNFYLYKSFRMYHDLSTTGDAVLGFYASASLRQGCTRNFDIILDIWLGVIHQYLDRKMNPNLFLRGAHSGGKSHAMHLIIQILIEHTYKALTSASPKAHFVTGDISDCIWFFEEAPPEFFNADNTRSGDFTSSAEAAWKSRLTANEIIAEILYTDPDTGKRSTQLIRVQAKITYVMATNMKGYLRYDDAILSRFHCREMGVDKNPDDRAIESENLQASQDMIQLGFTKLRLQQALCWYVAKLQYTYVLPDCRRVETYDLIEQVLENAGRNLALKVEDTRHKKRADMYTNSLAIWRAVMEEFFFNPVADRTREFQPSDMLRLTWRMFAQKDDAMLSLRLLDTQWIDQSTSELYREIYHKYIEAVPSTAIEREHGIDAAYHVAVTEEALNNPKLKPSLDAFNAEYKTEMSAVGLTAERKDEIRCRLASLYHLVRYDVVREDPRTKGRVLHTRYEAVDPDRQSARIRDAAIVDHYHLCGQIKDTSSNREFKDNWEKVETIVSNLRRCYNRRRDDDPHIAVLEVCFDGRGSQYEALQINDPILNKGADSRGIELVMARSGMEVTSDTNPVYSAIEHVMSHRGIPENEPILMTCRETIVPGNPHVNVYQVKHTDRPLKFKSKKGADTGASEVLAMYDGIVGDYDIEKHAYDPKNCRKVYAEFVYDGDIDEKILELHLQECGLNRASVPDTVGPLTPLEWKAHTLEEDPTRPSYLTRVEATRSAYRGTLSRGARSSAPAPPPVKARKKSLAGKKHPRDSPSHAEGSDESPSQGASKRRAPNGSAVPVSNHVIVDTKHSEDLTTPNADGTASGSGHYRRSDITPPPSPPPASPRPQRSSASAYASTSFGRQWRQFGAGVSQKRPLNGVPQPPPSTAARAPPAPVQTLSSFNRGAFQPHSRNASATRAPSAHSGSHAEQKAPDYGSEDH